MADFKTHISTSTVLGIGYAGTGILAGVPIDSAMIAGGLCGVSGMLPDLDSDSGVPLREAMAFAAAVVPMFLVSRFEQLGLSYESMVLAGGSIYLLIRFGVSEMLKRYTVHRGMFHSIPAAIIFAELGFLICGCHDIRLRFFNAGGVLLGVLSHLALDELYSIEWARGRLRLKKSAGTALKFWGKDLWGNISVYAKLLLLTAVVLSEPVVLDHYGIEAPVAGFRRHDAHEHESTDSGTTEKESIYEAATSFLEELRR